MLDTKTLKSYGITQQRYLNLKKLRDNLIKWFPTHHDNFHMGCYFDNTTKKIQTHIEKEDTYANRCHSTACAVGYGPLCGIRVLSNEIMPSGNIDWEAYAERVFIKDSDLVWNFIFNSLWSQGNSYPRQMQEAIARLSLLLLGKVPKNLLINPHNLTYRTSYIRNKHIKKYVPSLSLIRKL